MVLQATGADQQRQHCLVPLAKYGEQNAWSILCLPNTSRVDNNYVGRDATHPIGVPGVLLFLGVAKFSRGEADIWTLQYIDLRIAFQHLLPGE